MGAECSSGCSKPQKSTQSSSIPHKPPQKPQERPKVRSWVVDKQANEAIKRFEGRNLPAKPQEIDTSQSYPTFQPPISPISHSSESEEDPVPKQPKDSAATVRNLLGAFEEAS